MAAEEFAAEYHRSQITIKKKKKKKIVEKELNLHQFRNRLSSFYLTF